MNPFRLKLVLLTLAVAANNSVVKAQSISPARDGVNSQVRINGNTYDITGGQFSTDGTNLFHSLSQFGLNQNEIANFLSNPNIQNILTRVSGGNASIINGLIQVTGGNSNLYLMNPAGFVFGRNASLNVPGSFTATTANSIGFGNANFFSSVGSNDYAALIGNPSSFVFTHQLPGSIFNAGNLAVGNGNNLSLFAGTVISSGSLSAPKGQVTVASVPGKNLLRLSQQGSLLSLEFSPINNDNYNNLISPISLAQLITGGNAASATDVKLNSDGSFDLTGGIKLEPGDIATKQITAGNAVFNANNNLKLVGSNLQTTGDLNLLARNNVIVRDNINQLNSTSIKSGGSLYIQGNQGIDILALESSRNGNKPFQSGGDLTLTSNGIISTDAHFQSGRNFNTQNLNGETANLLSLYDPIFDVGTDFEIFSYTGASLQVTAGGNISYDSVNISAIDPAVHPTNPALFLTAGGNITGNGNVVTSVPTGNLLVNFQAGGDINIQNVTTQGGDISLNSTNGAINTFTLWSQGNTNGGKIDVKASNNINIGALSSAFLGSSTDIGNAGNINITSTAGGITLGDSVYAFRANGGTLGSHGDVVFNAFGDININVAGSGTSSKLVSFNSSDGKITTASIESSITNGSAITLNAANGIESNNANLFQTAGGTFNAITTGNIQLGIINTNGGSVILKTSTPLNLNRNIITNGGDITLSGSTITTTGAILNSSSTNQSGTITLESSGNISTGTLIFGATDIAGIDNPLQINAPGIIDINVSPVNNGADILIGNIISANEIIFGTGIPLNINTNGGSILLKASTLNLSRNITTNGGNITLGGNSITTTGVALNSSGTNKGGIINLDSTGDISTGLLTFGATSSTGIDNPLQINTSGIVNINGGVNNNGADLTIGNITASSQINFNGLSQINTDGGNLFLNSSGTLSIAQPVLTSGGSITLIGANVDTSATTLNAAQTGGAGGAVSITATNGNIAADGIIGNTLNTTGTIQLGGNVTTANAQLYNDAVQINGANIVLTTTDNPITFNSTVDGQVFGNNSLTLNPGNGDITFNNNVGINQPLNQLNVNGRATINGNIITVNSQTYLGSLTVGGGDIALNSINNGSISFNTNVNANGNLAVNSGGLTSFAGTVNARSLTTDASGTSEIQNNVTTTNGQNYGGAVILDNTQTTLTNTNGTITFNSTLNGETSGTNSLTINTDRLVFADKVGGIIPLKDITIQTQQALNLNNSIRTQRGNITINAPEISASNVSTNGGNVSLTSSSKINTTSGIIDTTGIGVDSGDINILAPGELILGNLTTFSRAARAGKINLTSQNENITSGDLNATGNTQGGEVKVIARTSVSTGRITSNATLGNAGNVTIDPIGDVAVRFINAQGGTSGVGGNIDITAGRYFRASDTFIDQNGLTASISTAGSLENGSFTLRHFGGFVGVPFDIGNVTINGTAGEITTGLTNRLTVGQSFPYLYSQGAGNNAIRLITATEPIVPPPPNNIITPSFLEETKPQPPNQLSVQNHLETVDIDLGMERLETSFSRKFQNYFGSFNDTLILKFDEAKEILAKIEQATGARPALVYINFVPDSTTENTSRDSDQLEIIVITGKGKPIRKVIYSVTRAEVLATAGEFRSTVTDKTTEDYLAPSQKLYNWLIKPIQADLQQKQINNLLFLMDDGLRSLAVAALHDGKQFLVEKYSVGLTPSLSLTDTRYADIKKMPILAAGASKFKEQNALPAVPVELSLLTQKLWRGNSLLNEQFTLNSLLSQRRQTPFGIIHFATHGEFKPGQPKESYIQFWDKKLRLDQIRGLGFNSPAVELLVLSACRTAVGDTEAELGFAGIATQSGVKSALASLWYVSDEGTLALITNFYKQLGDEKVKIKAEALRQAQLAMIKGKIRIDNGKVFSPAFTNPVDLPPELADLYNDTLNHPYYWASFTMIGSPW